MGKQAAGKANSQLSDGRTIRALVDTKGTLGKRGKNAFTQVEMFELRPKGLLPSNERPMNVKEHDESIRSGAWKEISANSWWRTNLYGVYRKGFEKDLDVQIGEKVVWVEDGIAPVFNVPDVKHPHNNDKGLREATGMVVFDLDKLQYDGETNIVSVSSDFNPETDVFVVDVMRPRGWALVDANGIPLRTKPSDEDTLGARHSYVKHSDEFEGEATGWHGSLACDVDGFYFGRRRYVVGALVVWSGASGVATIGRSAAAPQIEVAGEKLVKVADPESLLQRATRLTEIAEDLTERLGNLLTEQAHAQLIKPLLDEAVFLRELSETIKAIHA